MKQFAACRHKSHTPAQQPAAQTHLSTLDSATVLATMTARGPDGLRAIARSLGQHPPNASRPLSRRRRRRRRPNPTIHDRRPPLRLSSLLPWPELGDAMRCDGEAPSSGTTLGRSSTNAKSGVVRDPRNGIVKRGLRRSSRGARWSRQNIVKVRGRRGSASASITVNPAEIRDSTRYSRCRSSLMCAPPIYPVVHDCRAMGASRCEAAHRASGHLRIHAEGYISHLLYCTADGCPLLVAAPSLQDHSPALQNHGNCFSASYCSKIAKSTFHCTNLAS
ncbi:hypothetical protein BKA80DRAFT_2754 [Phyllosticta citrichinensis]